MQSFIGVSLLLLVLLVRLVPAQITPTAQDNPRRVITLMEVYQKSMCQPMEQLVDVEQEFPDDVEYIYMPACVPLLRCSGCCSDDILECHPTLKQNVTIQLMRLDTKKSSRTVQLTFVEHKSCECRPRTTIQTLTSTIEAIKRRSQRKHKKTVGGCGKCHFPFH